MATMELNQLSYNIIGCAHYERQKWLDIKYNDIILPNAYKIDVLVENKIILELKAVDNLQPIHTAQLLTYMKLANITIGLLINFNTANLQHGIKRYVK